MELDPVSKQLRPDEPQLDLYTIPSHSSWFLWDEIHETEKKALKEFFDWKSMSRTPKVYKEYRDFIINKYREDPSRKLTFTEVRKSLVGDVSLLHKVFGLLEKWGLINFGASSGHGEGVGEARVTVKVEEGVPNAVRVGANPNDLKPLSAITWVANRGSGNTCGIVLPPLASYKNVFGDVKKEGLVCGSCGEHCDSGHHKYKEGEFLICTKCFENGSYGENRSKEDFSYNEPDEKGGNTGVEWTEAETLLLLESIVKHGDDWDRVAQSVHTKTKADCIAKLIDLPFGEVPLGSGHKNDKHSGSLSNLRPGHLSSAESQGTIKTEGQRQDREQTNDTEQNQDVANQGPPLKRQCVASLSDASSSLISQASALSTLVGPHITAAAAEAAVTVLCEETSCSKEVFSAEDSSVTNGLKSPAMNCETERVFILEDSGMESQTESASRDALKKKDIPPTLQIRAAIATGLGAAAARAKLLADEEDREIEHLVATIIETQMKKLQSKMKTVEALELLMEKEYAETKEEEECLLEERIDIIQKTLSSGVPRWKDHPSLQS